MSKIMMEIISSRLGDKELLSCEINRLIKDVFNIVGKDKSYESSSLKQALRSLGWEEHILDYRTLELIRLYLEGRCATEAYSYNRSIFAGTGK